MAVRNSDNAVRSTNIDIDIAKNDVSNSYTVLNL